MTIKETLNLIAVIVLALMIFSFFNKVKNTELDTKIEAKKEIVDSLIVQERIIEKHYYHTKEAAINTVNKTIVKYDTIYIPLDSAKCNDKLKEATQDIQILASLTKQSYKDCDSLLSIKEAKSKTLQDIIELYQSKKTPLITPQLGAGLRVANISSPSYDFHLNLGARIRGGNSIHTSIAPVTQSFQINYLKDL